jgi:CheY-like chemotaxis protein
MNIAVTLALTTILVGLLLLVIGLARSDPPPARPARPARPKSDPVVAPDRPVPARGVVVPGTVARPAGIERAERGGGAIGLAGGTRPGAAVAGLGQLDGLGGSPTPLPAWRTIERLRILVVDDEPMIGGVIARLLAQHEVTTLTSGRAALALLASDDRFDALLCDLMMPGMSGLELAAAIAVHHPELSPRIVFLAGAAPATETILHRTAMRWVTKPVRYAPLVLRISDTVAAARARDCDPAGDPAQAAHAGSS